MARPAATPARIADDRACPWLTSSTARTAPAKPLTEPTDRSISPSSSTSTMPMEIMPIGRSELLIDDQVARRQEARLLRCRRRCR